VEEDIDDRFRKGTTKLDRLEQATKESVTLQLAEEHGVVDKDLISFEILACMEASSPTGVESEDIETSDDELVQFSSSIVWNLLFLFSDGRGGTLIDVIAASFNNCRVGI
jgi:hypothetical protein